MHARLLLSRAWRSHSFLSVAHPVPGRRPHGLNGSARGIPASTNHIKGTPRYCSREGG